MDLADRGMIPFVIEIRGIYGPYQEVARMEDEPPDNMISDIKASFELISLLGELARVSPSSIGFSLVCHGGQPCDDDYLHMINLTAITLFAFHCEYQVGPEGQTMKIPHVYRATQNVHGRRAVYRLTIPKEGIYFRGGANFFVPLKDLSGVKTSDDLRLRFFYKDSQGKDHASDLRYVVRAEEVTNRFPLSSQCLQAPPDQ